MDLVRIKICGLRRPQDVEYVNAVVPDFVGFVFAQSRRQVTGEEAAQLAHGLNPAVERVGVFVDQPVDFVAGLFDAGVIEYAQLHGEETAEYISDLRRRTKQSGEGIKIIKAVKVRCREDLVGVDDIDCDRLLLDAWPAEGQAAGGNGKPFDWELVQSIKKPFFLAGGITVNNVRMAIEQVQPFGIDVSSSLETDGYKDFDKIKAFMDMVRQPMPDHGR